MATESLKLNITADNKSAIDALKQVDAQTKSLDTTFVSTAGKMGDVTKASNSAAFALTNVGRVAQDLPFGFMGIQNNLKTTRTLLSFLTTWSEIRHKHV